HHISFSQITDGNAGFLSRLLYALIFLLSHPQRQKEALYFYTAAPCHFLQNFQNSADMILIGMGDKNSFNYTPASLFDIRQNPIGPYLLHAAASPVNQITISRYRLQGQAV